MDPLLLDLDSTIAKVTAKLGELKIPFAYTGGLAVIAYGDPRTTQGVDMRGIAERNDPNQTLADASGSDFGP